MKKYICIGALCLLSICLIVVAVCKFKSCKPDEQPTVVTLNEYVLDLEVYTDYQLFVVDLDPSKTIEWSSSNSEVVSVENGRVLAESAGSANVTATVDGVSATCIVRVSDNGYVPYIKSNLIGGKVKLFVGGEFTFEPSVSYNGIEYTDGEFSLIGENGIAVDGMKISASSVGNYDVRLKASWRKYGQLVEIKIPVEVVFDANIEVSKNLSIYTSKIDGHVMDHDINAVYKESGKAVNSPITWEIIDGEEFITLSGNHIVGKDEGIAHVVGKAQSTIGTEIVSPQIEIEVLVPEIAVEGELFIERQEQTVLNVSVPSGKAVTGVKDGDSMLNYNSATKVLQDIDFGERKWLIYTTDEDGDKIAYKYDVTVASLIIRQASDLAKMFDGISKADGYAYDGYIIVENDIDASDYTHISWANWSGYFDGGARKGEGFQGYFDGKGHTISGMKIGMNSEYMACGVFGTIGAQGVVKNVSFTDLTSGSGNKDSWIGVTLAVNVFGGKIENVFVQAADRFMAPVLYAMGSSEFKKAVFYGEDYTSRSLFNMVDTGDVVLDGVIAIGNKTASNVSHNAVVAKNVLSFGLDYMNDENYLTLDLNKLYNNEYWDVESANIPVLKSMTAEKNIKVYTGKSVNIAKYGTYQATTLPSGISVSANGILSVANNVDSQTFTVYAVNGNLNLKTKINITVMKATEISGNFVIDKSLNASANIDLSSVITGTPTIESLILGEQVLTDGYTFNNGIITLSQSLIASMEEGEKILTLTIGANTYFAEVILATKVIKVAEDLSSIYQNVETLANGRKAYYGYYVLGNNIDATGTTLIVPEGIAYWSGYYDSSNAMEDYQYKGNPRNVEGFQGVFNGNGYEVKGLTVGEASGTFAYGIFGTIGKNGVVKNVSFIGVNNAHRNDCAYAGLALNVFGGTIENVIFHASSVYFFAPIMYLGGGSTLKDCVFYMWNGQSKGVAHMTDTDQPTGSGPATIINVFSISYKPSINPNCAGYAEVMDFNIDYTTNRKGDGLTFNQASQRFMTNCENASIWRKGTQASWVDIPVIKNSTIA